MEKDILKIINEIVEQDEFRMKKGIAQLKKDKEDAETIYKWCSSYLKSFLSQFLTSDYKIHEKLLCKWESGWNSCAPSIVISQSKSDAPINQRIGVEFFENVIDAIEVMPILDAPKLTSMMRSVRANRQFYRVFSCLFVVESKLSLEGIRDILDKEYVESPYVPCLSRVLVLDKGCVTRKYDTSTKKLSYEIVPHDKLTELNLNKLIKGLTVFIPGGTGGRFTVGTYLSKSSGKSQFSEEDY